MKKPLIVAFYYGINPKIEAKYKSAAELLIADCEKFGYEYNIVKLPPGGRFHINVRPENIIERYWLYRYIPRYIWGQSNAQERDILYLHCDTRILKPLPEFDTEFDVTLERAWCRGKANTPLASPIYIKSNSESRSLSFIYSWSMLCNSFLTNKSEHYFLCQAFKMWQNDPGNPCKVGFFKEKMASRNQGDDVYLYF